MLWHSEGPSLCWERNRERMEREAWRVNVPHHCSFHGSRVRLLGHSRPITWETCYWVSFALWALRFFSLNGVCLKWLPNSIGGLQKSPPLSLEFTFIRLFHPSVVISEALCDACQGWRGFCHPGQCWTGSDAADYLEKRERRKWTQRKLGGTVKD